MPLRRQSGPRLSPGAAWVKAPFRGSLGQGSLQGQSGPKFSPGATCVKAPVVTDVVEDAIKCVETTRGLPGLVGGAGQRDVPPRA